MQSIKLSDYLTPRENRKIDRILDKAAKRVRQKDGSTVKVVKAFLFLKCPLQKGQGEIPESHPECWREMSKLMMLIQEYCKSNGCFQYTSYIPEGEDDELPFD